MIGHTHIGTVVDTDSQGHYVEVFVSGQTVRYGPMHYVSPTGESLLFTSGDIVVITAILYRDQFVILGKYVDMNPPPRQDYEIDSDGDGVIDVIQKSNTEAPQ